MNLFTRLIKKVFDKGDTKVLYDLGAEVLAGRPLLRVNENNNPDNNGKYILFGEYPQTIKKASVRVGTTANSDGYFLGSDGARYAKVVAEQWETTYKFSNNKKVTSGTTYYFKVQPIKWRILEDSSGEALILCESIIANKRCNECYSGTNKDGYYANNYMNSEIRAWLNDEFYNKAFNILQKGLILTTNVDNSVYSTGNDPNKYACANTNDKIFLPSYREMVNAEYGFSSDTDKTTTRERTTSDYSRATNAYMYEFAGSYYGNGWWCLRSPGTNDCSGARSIYDDGLIYNNARGSSNGVVPALKIQLS